ncbi:hypothetical protein MASR2M78_02450 [Treponema sp.]
MRTFPHSRSTCDAGSAFPLYPFECTVHSVFTHALNFKVTGNDALLSLISDKNKLHPRAALVPQNFNTLQLKVGMLGSFDGEKLVFPASCSSFKIPPYRHDKKDERPRRLLKNMEIPARIQEAVRILRDIGREIEPSIDYLFEGIKKDVCHSEYAKHFVDGALSIETAFTLKSVPQFNQALTGLIGLGPGLTPSGDDFICGYLAGCRSLSLYDKDLEAFLDAWAGTFCTKESMATGILSRTNGISAAFLWEAAQARFSQALLAFANSILGFGDIEKSLQALANIGHSSGINAAQGYLFSLRRNHAPSIQLYGSQKP